MSQRSMQVAWILLATISIQLGGLANENWPFHSYTGPGSVLAQGEGLVYYASGDDIWLAATDGSCPINLTNSPMVFDRSPTVSVGRQNGELVAFESHASASHGGAIWVMNPDGTGRQQVTNPTAHTSHHYPMWSVNCTDIFYSVWDSASGAWSLRKYDCASKEDSTVPIQLSSWPGRCAAIGSGTMVRVRADSDEWIQTGIRIGEYHHAWLYLVDDPVRGSPCCSQERNVDDCGLDDIELTIRLRGLPSCARKVSAYDPVYLSPAFFEAEDCSEDEGSWVDLCLGDLSTDRDNIGAVVAILIPAIPSYP